MLAVVITGPPGSGKTSVLSALTDLLSDDEVRHATIEIESLVWAHPAVDDERWSRHLRALVESYREAGYDLLLLAHTLETDDDVRRLRDTVDADRLFLVRLEADPDLLEKRLTEREPPTFSALADLISHSRELAVTMRRLTGVDVVAATDGTQAGDVASRIRATGPSALRI